MNDPHAVQYEGNTRQKKAIKGGFPVHFISTFALHRVFVLWVSFERDR